MHKSKTIILLKQFGSWELKELEKFIQSKYFNTSDLVTKTFNILKKDYPNFESSWLQKEKLFKKIFDNVAYDESKLRYVFSDLSKVIEEFIIHKELEKDTQQKRLLLLNFYMNKDLEKYFQQTFEEADKFHQKQHIKDEDYYFYKYLLEEKSYIYSQKQKSRSIDANLQIMVDNLDLFYLSAKLKHIGEMLTREMLLKVTYEKNLISEITQHIENKDYSANSAVNIYYQVVMMHLQPDNEAYYRHLIHLLDIHKNDFNQNELVDMYVFAQNYCTNKINSGHSQYLSEIFLLYKKMIDLNAIYENGYVRPNVFKNIITVGLRLEEYEWTEKFINEYKDKLEPSHIESATNYNLAWLYFAKKDYKKALKQLNSVEFIDIFYILGAKCLLLKIFYELNDYDAFYSLTESFYVYLKRNMLISEYQKSTHINFIKHIKQLMKVRIDREKSSIEKCREQILESKVLDMNWFLKKIDELS
jgi:hypothetical protein